MPPVPAVGSRRSSGSPRRSRRSATTRSSSSAEGEAVERAERTESDEAFRALWSSARRDDDVLQTTQPGEALQLFAEATPVAAPSPALAAFTTTEPESAHERRERLRDERRALVAALARRTGEPHAAINARLNREVGAASVAASTVDQLERANEILRRTV